MAMSDVDLEAVRKDCQERSDADLASTLEALRASGADAEARSWARTRSTRWPPRSRPLDAREAIILTRSHVVSEFFHLDWTSRARRKIGVPVLHLLEHENFDEQAGGGEGVTGL